MFTLAAGGKSLPEIQRERERERGGERGREREREREREKRRKIWIVILTMTS